MGDTKHLTDATWKLANVTKIAEYLRNHLAAVGNIDGIRDADLMHLNDTVTEPGAVNEAI